MNYRKITTVFLAGLAACAGQISAQAHTVQPTADRGADKYITLPEDDNCGDAVFHSPFARNAQRSQRGHAAHSNQAGHDHGWNTYPHQRDTWNDDGIFTDGSGKHDHEFKGKWPHGATHPFGTPVVSEVNPVPVPAAMWLFGSGLAALAGLARRRRA